MIISQRLKVRLARFFGSTLMFGLLLFSAGTALAIEYGGFGARPAYPRAENPRTESIFIHTLEPGEVKEEGVTVLNNTKEKKTFLVFATDSVRSTDGAFACKQQVEEKNDVGAWIKLEKEEVTLDSMQSVLVPFTITVPGNAGVGEHNGCVLVQEKKEQAEGSAGVQLSFRTGLRVAVTIPGELIRKIEVIDFKISKQEDHDILLHPIVKNTGNVSVDANVKIVTRSALGYLVSENGGKYPILRGDTSEWNFEVKKPFWGGWYRSTLSVSYDENSGAGIGVDSGGQLTDLGGKTVWFFSLPSLLAGLIEVLVLLAVAWGVRAYLVARLVKNWIKKTWVEYEVRSEENINSIAARYGISWKVLAKVNTLKPPFALRAGDRIKVPPGRVN